MTACPNCGELVLYVETEQGRVAIDLHPSRHGTVRLRPIGERERGLHGVVLTDQEAADERRTLYPLHECRRAG